MLSVQKAKTFFGKKKVRQGLIFATFMLGSWIGLRQFANLRYKYRKVKRVTEVLQEQGVQIEPVDPNTLTIEAMYEDMVKPKDLDSWQNKRIWRPWEHEGEEAPPTTEIKKKNNPA